MKKQIKSLQRALVASACLLAPLFAQAGEVHFGAKAGLYEIKLDTPNVDASIAPMVGARLGYDFLNLVAADIGAEAELTQSVGKNKLEVGNVEVGKISATSIGGYLTARSLGPVYAIGRIGMVKTKIDNKGDSSSITKPAMSAGIGFSFIGVASEIELTRYSLKEDNKDDYAYFVSYGITF